MNKYEVIIYWHAVDQVFVAEMPELKGCVAHGETQEEALREVSVVADEWLRLAADKGWPIPEPKGRLLFA